MTRRLVLRAIRDFGLSAMPISAWNLHEPAPKLIIRQPGSPPIPLSHFRGKVVVIELLHTTCPNCQRCSRLLEAMYREFGHRGFQALGVAFNDFAELLIGDYIQQLGLTFPVGFASRAEVVNCLQVSPVKPLHVPQLMFVDRRGLMRGLYSGRDSFFENEESNMREQVRRLLSEANPHPERPLQTPAIGRPEISSRRVYAQRQR